MPVAISAIRIEAMIRRSGCQKIPARLAKIDMDASRPATVSAARYSWIGVELTVRLYRARTRAAPPWAPCGRARRAARAGGGVTDATRDTARTARRPPHQRRRRPGPARP